MGKTALVIGYLQSEGGEDTSHKTGGGGGGGGHAFASQIPTYTQAHCRLIPNVEYGNGSINLSTVVRICLSSFFEERLQRRNGLLSNIGTFVAEIPEEQSWKL